MKKIGIVGGGQLGKMLILDGRRLDYQFMILDPAADCPAHAISDLHIVAEFDDIEAIKRLASMVDVVTYELEHISVEALEEIEATGKPVYPSSHTLKLIQDKLVQKRWLKEKGIAAPDFVEITSVKDILEAGEKFGYPMLLKARTGGYDGKGNYVVKSADDAQEGYAALGYGKVKLMAERFVDFSKEISVLACRSVSGEMVVFPVAENYHIDNILDETTVPAVIPDSTAVEAMETAKACLEAFTACGMMCIEMFVTRDGHVMVNEIAPRPHNSGHYTIEGCYTSQFEQHIRAILDQPLGDCSLIRPTAMKNIIGTHEGHAFVHGLKKAMSNKNVKVHIYGKSDVRCGRKMGHVTATAESLDEALRQVRAAHDAVYFTDSEDEL